MAFERGLSDKDERIAPGISAPGECASGNPSDLESAGSDTSGADALGASGNACQQGEGVQRATFAQLGARPRPEGGLAPAQRLAVGIAAALCVILIAVSAAFLFSPGADHVAEDLLTTTKSSQADSAGQSASSDAADEAGGEQADDARADAPSGEQASATAPSGAAASGSVSQGASNANAGSTPPSGTSGAGQAQPAPSAPQANTITVSISVSSAAADGSVSASGTFTFREGATVYDALCATGLNINASSTAYGVYVAAINGLAEHDPRFKEPSGWMYYVNGGYVNMSCDRCVLSDGDVVSWTYVTG